MIVLIVTWWSTLLSILVSWRLPISTSSLGGIGRRSLLLRLTLWLAIACLLGLIPCLLLPVSCRLAIATLTVGS